MINLPYRPLPQEGFVSLGGFHFVNPRAWKNYLDQVIQQHYAGYAAALEADQKWMENNCILASLEKYLFSEYGVVIPKDNLFKLYNLSGEGLLPEQILEAITAVISPLGFEIDKVLVADDELRQAMGHPDQVVGLSEAAEFHGRAGIGMINIRSGYSHAFFWKKMNQRKFTWEEFRMAVLVRRSSHLLEPERSVSGSIQAYCRLAKEWAWFAGDRQAVHVLIQELLKKIDHREAAGSPDLQGHVDRHLEKLNLLFDIRGCREEELALFTEAGALVRRIFQEGETIQ